jgi:hypothetical protein
VPKPKAKARPHFDAEPLHDDDFEGACPIPDEDGEIVLRRGKTTKEGTKRGKTKTGTAKKPAG